jgi:hypothetical protein
MNGSRYHVDHDGDGLRCLLRCRDLDLPVQIQNQTCLTLMGHVMLVIGPKTSQLCLWAITPSIWACDRGRFFFHTSPRGDRFLLLSIMEKFYNQVRNMSRKKEQKTPPTTSVQARISLRESWPSYRLRDRQDHKSSTS